MNDELLSLAEAVLREGTGRTVACAESCTGGLLQGVLTEVPGSSKVFRGGVVSYCNEVKERVLGVPGRVLEEFGAVSGQCAEAMAKGVLELCGTDFAVSVTGVAGPGNEGTEPAGSVWFGLAARSGEGVKTLALHRQFQGGRGEVRRRAVGFALEELLRTIRDGGPASPSPSVPRPGGQRHLLEMARQDFLTGLATRWYFQDYLERARTEEHVTCIYFDLDHFKELNDAHGHQAGDRALAATAEMTRREFADGFAARMGGDEFMVVLLGERPVKEVERRVSAFLKGLADYYSGVPFMRGLSVSAGIAQSTPASPKSIDRLVRESDLALYQAKGAGRAQCRVYAAQPQAIEDGPQ